MNETKTCVCCKEEKFLSSFFRCRKNLDGLMTRCKECHKISKEKSRQKHLEKSKESQRQYRERNKDKIKKHYKETYIPKPKRIQYQWPPPIEKCCSVCNIIKPVSEFVKSSKTKHGIGSQCRKCVAKKSKERRLNPEKNLKNKRYAKEYRIKNRDKLKEYSLKKYYENRERYKRRGKKWRTLNKDYVKNHASEYRKNNKALCNTHCHARRARKRNAFHPDHNKVIEKVFQLMAIRVKNCMGVGFHVDHILPLNCGGYHHHLNLQVIPEKLNESKGDDLNYKHPLLKHWSELPDFLLDRIKLVPLGE